MPDPVNVTKAQLWELKPDGTEASPAHRVQVQFNPETLKVTFSNQVVPPANAGAAPAGNRAAIQYVGRGTTKLSVQLWFDVSAKLPEGTPETTDDVRRVTKEVAYFITPKPGKSDKNKFIPPGVRFLWGTFQFDGIMDSLDESLEFFSPEGKPQRASMSLSLTQQEIQFQFGDAAGTRGTGAAGAKAPGSQPLTQAPAGATVPGLADSLGRGGDWQAIASLNGIENARLLQPGQLLDLNVNVSAGAGLSAGIDASASASLSGSASGSVAGSASAGLSTGGGISAQGGISL